MKHPFVLIRKYSYPILLFLLLISIFSCSTKKNTTVSRTFHNITAKYNILFNGNESYKKGLEKVDQAFTDDYTQILSVFKYADEKAANSVIPEMDRTIKKVTLMISMHSITVKPEIKDKGELPEKKREFYNKSEYNKWIDNGYLLMGKAYFHKREYNQARETLLYILNRFKNEKIIFETNIWLARLNNETGRFKDSEEIMILLDKNIDFPNRLKEELYSTWTDLYIKQKKYEDAIPLLEKTIDKVNRKKEKIRYIFLLAQLYEKTGDLNKASENYAKVIKMNPPYEMTFHSKINRALSYQSGKEKKSIEQQLKRMLKDDKNLEYQDQIYYALGNIAFKEGKIDKAITNYELSILANVENNRQLARSYITIADIYYTKPDYIYAQAYYDSAIGIIDPEYPDYDATFAKSNNLTNLVKEIKTVELEDSVQVLSKLSDVELRQFIDKMIDQVKQKEEEERQRMLLKTQEELYAQSFENENRMLMSNEAAGTKWYFYNPTALNLGKKEFRLKWGNRKLEDNWRRKNKSFAGFGEFAVSETSSQSSETIAETEINYLSRDFYMKNIPRNDSMLNESHRKIQSALFNMGVIYKDNLDDYNMAILSFEELLKRYPVFDKKVQVYYHLYGIYVIQKNIEKLEFYKNKIIREFPESNYAKILNDPEYFKNLKTEENKITAYYNDTYNLFKAEDYVKVLQRANYALENYEGHELISQFSYLRALAIGKTKDVESFKESLYKIVADHPNTGISENAKILLAFLDKQHPEVKEKEEQKVAEELYKYNENSIHYAAFIVPANRSVNQFIFNIINFNLDFYEKMTLEVIKEELDEMNNIVIVKQFENKETALGYFNDVKENESVFKDVIVSGIENIIISQENLDILKNDKSSDKYLRFYNRFYK